MEMTLIFSPKPEELAKESRAAVGSVPVDSTNSRGVMQEDSCGGRGECTGVRLRLRVWVVVRVGSADEKCKLNKSGGLLPS